MKYLVILIVSVGSLKARIAPECAGPWCANECPPGTYRYAVGCDYRQPEPTCKNPRPVKDMRGQICDYQACYCNPPTVRDETSKKCVRLRDCPRRLNAVTPRVPVTPRKPVTPRHPVLPKPRRPYIYSDREW